MTLSKRIIFETTFASFTANDILGEGGSGRIYKVTDESGSVFAAKLLNPAKVNKEKRKRFKNELLFGSRNQHPNVITVVDHGVFNDGKQNSPFYVMPLYTGSLRTLLKARIEPSKVLVYFAQLLDGVEAAHLQKIVHRDLKPENVLYDPVADRLLVADFGIAHFEEEELYTAVETAPGTRLANFQYAAPEQRGRGLCVDLRADIYALGLVLNEMFTGEVPQGTGYKTISSVVPEYGYLDDLVSALLRQSVAERPASIEVVKQQLIGRKNEFVISQRLSQLKQTVVPVTDLDDPLIVDPPQLVSLDYNQGTLTLFFQRPVNEKWVSALRNIPKNLSFVGKAPGYWDISSPEDWTISGDMASIPASEGDAQQIIDHFKSWLPAANRKYEEMIRQEKQEAEQRQSLQLQRKVEEEERRLRILKTVTL